MHLKGHFTNINDYEMTITKLLLQDNKCLDITVQKTERGVDYDYVQGCNDDIDIVRVLAVCLFCNDRSPAQIAVIKDALVRLLRQHERVVGSR